MMGGSIAHKRGGESLEASDLDYTYMRMTWLYNGKRKDYVASQKGEPFLGAKLLDKQLLNLLLIILHANETISEQVSAYGNLAQKINQNLTFIDLSGV